MTEASEMDAKLLKVAQDKQKGKPTTTTTDSLPSTPGQELTLISGRAGPNQENVSFSAAALSTFKASKRRRMALSARSGLKDKRPLPEEKNRI